jgi:hypothetical protein
MNVSEAIGHGVERVGEFHFRVLASVDDEAPLYGRSFSKEGGLVDVKQALDKWLNNAQFRRFLAEKKVLKRRALRSEEEDSVQSFATEGDLRSSDAESEEGEEEEENIEDLDIPDPDVTTTRPPSNLTHLYRDLIGNQDRRGVVYFRGGWNLTLERTANLLKETAKFAAAATTTGVVAVGNAVVHGVEKYMGWYAKNRLKPWIEDPHIHDKFKTAFPDFETCYKYLEQKGFNRVQSRILFWVVRHPKSAQNLLKKLALSIKLVRWILVLLSFSKLLPILLRLGGSVWKAAVNVVKPRVALDEFDAYVEAGAIDLGVPPQLIVEGLFMSSLKPKTDRLVKSVQADLLRRIRDEQMHPTNDELVYHKWKRSTMITSSMHVARWCVWNKNPLDEALIGAGASRSNWLQVKDQLNQ